MIAEIERVGEGRSAVRCQVTFAKRILREYGRIVDHHPLLGPTLLLMLFGLAGFGVVRLVVSLL
jgi:hypothetical protein